MLRIISIIVLLATFVWVYLVQRKYRGSASPWQWFGQQAKTLGSDLMHLKGITGSALKGHVYFLTLICFIILAVSGLIPFLISGQPLSGFLLLVHVATTPLFAVLMVVVALIWADTHRFDRKNWRWIKTHLLAKSETTDDAGKNDLLKRIFFWLIVLFSMLLTSIVFSMYPIFDSVGQKFLLNFHKFSAIVLTVVVILHTCLLLTGGADTKTFQK